jgi:preprotein translocase subunit YajC
VGDRILTIGGFIGTLTYIDFEDNIARVKLADGVEVQMVPRAISGKRQNGASSGEAAQNTSGDSSSSADESSEMHDG